MALRATAVMPSDLMRLVTGLGACLTTVSILAVDVGITNLKSEMGGKCVSLLPLSLSVGTGGASCCLSLSSSAGRSGASCVEKVDVMLSAASSSSKCAIVSCDMMGDSTLEMNEWTLCGRVDVWMSLNSMNPGGKASCVLSEKLDTTLSVWVAFRLPETWSRSKVNGAMSKSPISDIASDHAWLF